MHYMPHSASNTTGKCTELKWIYAYQNLRDVDHG